MTQGGKGSACNVGDLGMIPGWEDSLEKGMATHSSILAWRRMSGYLLLSSMDRGAWQAPWNYKEWDMTEQLTLSHTWDRPRETE